MRRDSRIITVGCKRCGTPVATLAKSIIGTHDLHRRYSGICSKCITPAEENEIMEEHAKAFLDSARRGF